MINIRPPKNRIPNPDFDAPIFESGVWKVREQLYPENRGYKIHKFESEKEAMAFCVKINVYSLNQEVSNDF